MSDINNDQEVVRDGRKNALEGVEAPLRDRIVDKLYDKLIELEIPRKTDDSWARGNANRTVWLERQSAYLASWDEHLIGDTSGAFEGSSKLHIPMPFIVMKTLHARFMQAIWQDPPCHTKARNEFSMERVQNVQDVMRYYLIDGCNYGKGAEEVVDRWVWDWLCGTGLMKGRWDCTYTRFIDVQTVVEQGPPQFQVDEEGNERAIPTFVPVEKEVKVTKKTFEGPVLDLVDPEDLLIIGGGGDPDLADAVYHRQYMTASELWTLVDRRVFKKDAVELIIAGGPDSIEGSEGSQLKTQRAQNAGQAQADSEQDLDRYEIIEAYLKVDVDGSGVNSDVIAWVHRKSRTLLRATYLYRVSRTGERPFVKADFHLRKGQEYGTGIPELLYPLSKELDAMHNMRIDFGLISTMPVIFYRASSGIDPETIQLEPGMMIPVDNPQTDVFIPNFGNRTVFGFQEEASIQTMIERLTGVNELAMGSIGGQGVTRTASGARALVGEMSANLDVHLRRLNRGWKKALRMVLHMLQQRIPDGLSFRITGDDGQSYWKSIRSKADVEGDFDLEVNPNSAASNPAIQQEMANQVMSAVADPLAIQLGIVTPAQYYEAKKNQLQAWGIRDHGRFLQKPQANTRTLTPVEEANRLLAGMNVPVTPEMDHQGFMDFWEMIKGDDQLLGQYNEEQVMMLARQAQAHAQMMQALAQVQAQAANAAQMQRNAAMSQQQAPAGMSPLAGAGAAGGGMNGGGQA
jgi:hypothetical protein